MYACAWIYFSSGTSKMKDKSVGFFLSKKKYRFYHQLAISKIEDLKLNLHVNLLSRCWKDANSNAIVNFFQKKIKAELNQSKCLFLLFENINHTVCVSSGTRTWIERAKKTDRNCCFCYILIVFKLPKSAQLSKCE